MSVVVGLKDGGKVYMGADSFESVGDVVLDSVGDKVFRIEQRKRPPILLGTTGFTRIADVLLHEVDWKLVAGAASPQDFAYCLSQEARDTLLQQGLMWHDEKEKSEVLSGSGLVAWKGSLFLLDGGCSVTELGGYGAIGAGGEMALGALWTFTNLQLIRPKDDPSFIVTRVVWAACALSPYCRLPVKLEVI